jgi:hypothetical protein
MDILKTETFRRIHEALQKVDAAADGSPKLEDLAEEAARVVLETPTYIGVDLADRPDGAAFGLTAAGLVPPMDPDSDIMKRARAALNYANTGRIYVEPVEVEEVRPLQMLDQKTGLPAGEVNVVAAGRGSGKTSALRPDFINPLLGRRYVCQDCGKRFTVSLWKLSASKCEACGSSEVYIPTTIEAGSSEVEPFKPSITPEQSEELEAKAIIIGDTDPEGRGK